jgi:hypothetical protein
MIVFQMSCPELIRDSRERNSRDSPVANDHFL